METAPRLGKMRTSHDPAAMSDSFPNQPSTAMVATAAEAGRCLQDEAWRATYAAAVRVITFHRANLEARMTIRRVQRDEPEPARDELTASE
ncbi:MAG: hypothetical protein JNJ42_14145 [Burkholderiaceae bacterium]|nr:hypothetical protein [Burkholderiaceae bacterium]